MCRTHAVDCCAAGGRDMMSTGALPIEISGVRAVAMGIGVRCGWHWQSQLLSSACRHSNLRFLPVFTPRISAPPHRLMTATTSTPRLGVTEEWESRLAPSTERRRRVTSTDEACHVPSTAWSVAPSPSGARPLASELEQTDKTEPSKAEGPWPPVPAARFRFVLYPFHGLRSRHTSGGRSPFLPAAFTQKGNGAETRGHQQTFLQVQSPYSYLGPVCFRL